MDDHVANARVGPAEGRPVGVAASVGSPQVIHIQNNIGQVCNGNFAPNHGSMVQIAEACVGGLPTERSAADPMSPPSIPPQCYNLKDLIDLLNPILDASHTRNLERSPPNSRCSPGTRRHVIEKVRGWVDRDLRTNHPHIIWIFGYAGCGKSAIAQEIAQIFARRDRLVACFFFLKGSGDRSSIRRFATSIASQVAASIPATGQAIQDAVRKNRGLLTTDNASLSAQFEHLVYLPINAVDPVPKEPFLIIIDAFDECEDSKELPTFIDSMIEFFDTHPSTPLRIVITSRVEDHIHQRLHSSNQVQLLNLVEHTSDADIAAALDAAIEKEKCRRIFACDKSWPSHDDRQKLIKHIGGSFIFMTTILKRLFDTNLSDGLTPMERLPLVLSMNPDFDELYASILAPSTGLPHFQDIISTIALAYRPFSIAELASFLCIPASNVANVLVNLHAIIQVPGDDRTPIALWHTSLRDFLCAKDRAGPFFANLRHHRRLAYRDSDRSHPPLGSLSQYLQKYALEHLRIFLETLHSRTDRAAEAKPPSPVHPLHAGPRETHTVAAYLLTTLRWWLWGLWLSWFRLRVEVGSRPIASGTAILSEDEFSIICVLNGPIFYDGQTALEAAIRAGKSEIVLAMVHMDIDEEARFQDGQTAVELACRQGKWEIVLTLVKSKTNVNALFQNNPHGTALQAACVSGSTRVVRELLAHGADPNLRCGSYGSALHACNIWFDHELIELLLNHTADPNVRDSDDATPLHDACSRGHISAAEALLKFGADPSLRDGRGRTALQLAREKRGDDSQIAQTLLQHGVVE